MAEAKIEGGVPILVSAAQPGHNNFLRYTAINAIGTLSAGDKTVLDLLVATLKEDNSPFLQNAVNTILKDRKEKGAVEALTEISKTSKSEEVRDAAKSAAAELGK